MLRWNLKIATFCKSAWVNFVNFRIETKYQKWLSLYIFEKKGDWHLFVDRSHRSPWKEAAWKKASKTGKRVNVKGTRKDDCLCTSLRKRILALFVGRSPWKGSLKKGSQTEKEWTCREPEKSQRVPKSRAKTATQAKRLGHQQTGGNSVGHFGNSQTWCPRWAWHTRGARLCPNYLAFVKSCLKADVSTRECFRGAKCTLKEPEKW